MAGRAPNALGEDPRPRFFPVADPGSLGLVLPDAPTGTAVRLWARSLAGMQKEVLVTTSPGGRAWRLASDEGADLNGYDEAPFPLGHLAAGMAASYAHEVLALAEQRRVRLRDLELTLDSWYTMEGSALRGTMVGGALPPEVTVRCTSPGAAELRGLVADAVHVAPVGALVRPALPGSFTLTVNGDRTPTGGTDGSPEPPPDPGARLGEVRVAHEPVPQPLVERVRGDAAEEEPDAGGLTETQSRRLHVRGHCRVREDGLAEVEVSLRRPPGATFRLLVGRPAAAGADDRAPAPEAYLAAGIAFCFMTQFGRYAAITRAVLDDHRLVQDLWLPPGGASGGAGAAGSAAPVGTHVYLNTPEGPDFGRRALAMSEQTCFLHALCRTPLRTRAVVRSP